MTRKDSIVVAVFWFIFVASLFFVVGLAFTSHQFSDMLITNACEKTYKLHKEYMDCLNKTKTKDLTVVFKNRECKQ